LNKKLKYQLEMKTERPSEIQTAFDIEFCWYMTQAAFAADWITAWFGIIR
jgi:hypothetical protein